VIEGEICERNNRQKYQIDRRMKIFIFIYHEEGMILAMTNVSKRNF